MLWCDYDGKVYVLEDCCLYCGVCLLFGWNFGGNIVCWYYGIEVDGGGMVNCVLVVLNCLFEGMKCVKLYLVEEKVGVIFLWFGDEVYGELVLLNLLEELVVEEYGYFLCVLNWKCNY